MIHHDPHSHESQPQLITENQLWSHNVRLLGSLATGANDLVLLRLSTNICPDNNYGTVVAATPDTEKHVSDLIEDCRRNTVNHFTKYKRFG